jgi:hypothetical protein
MKTDNFSKQLQRHINVLKQILDGTIENYTGFAEQQLEEELKTAEQKLQKYNNRCIGKN